MVASAIWRPHTQTFHEKGRKGDSLDAPNERLVKRVQLPAALLSSVYRQAHSHGPVSRNHLGTALNTRASDSMPNPSPHRPTSSAQEFEEVAVERTTARPPPNQQQRTDVRTSLRSAAASDVVQSVALHFTYLLPLGCTESGRRRRRLCRRRVHSRRLRRQQPCCGRRARRRHRSRWQERRRARRRRHGGRSCAPSSR